MDEIEKDNLIKRIRFKSLEYDITSNYKRLHDRLSMESLPDIRGISRTWRWIACAASIALIIVSSLYVMNLQSAGEMVWYETTAVPDAKTKIVLPDSSAVWLNANACLRYPRSFDEDIRKVDISGDAFFQVRKGDKPFIVDLGKLHIKVLGTSFNVVANRKDHEIIVTLLEGKIALYDNDKPGEPETILNPNNQAVYSMADGGITISSIYPETVTSWVTGIFRFNNRSLTQIATELERAFHVKIHIEGEDMRQKTFNAVFEDEETLDEILAILQISAKYNIERKRGEIYLR
ncbi:MAG: DUF4974 domain-containing protein [Tannerella sp.]|nr:DUF4974 domain-containing protein [Tannerella sp.]